MDVLLLEKFKKIKLLAMDFDGVMTDGSVYVDENGKETVRCSRRDGFGVEQLLKNGIKVIVISKEKSQVVARRCDKLQIECWYAIDSGEDKLKILKRYAEENNIKQQEICYVGDDINDLKCIKYASIGVAVADYHPDVKEVSDYVLQRKGGEHAIRELCDIILSSQ